MRSPFANVDAILKNEPDTVTFRGELYPVIHYYYECPVSGMRFTTTKLDEKNVVEQVYDVYRKQHNIPSPKEIKSARLQCGLSIAQAASLCGISEEEWKSYEDGEVPTIEKSHCLQNFIKQNAYV